MPEPTIIGDIQEIIDNLVKARNTETGEFTASDITALTTLYPESSYTKVTVKPAGTSPA